MQFLGDIKAVREGDYLHGFAAIQNPKTGAYIKVHTRVNLRELVSKTREIINDARAYAAQIEAGMPAASLPPESAEAIKAMQTATQITGVGWGWGDLVKGIKHLAAHANDLKQIATNIAKDAPGFLEQARKLAADVKPAAALVSGLGQNEAANVMSVIAFVTRRKLIRNLMAVAVAPVNENKWIVPELGLTFEATRAAMQLIRSARSGNPKGKAVLARIVLMARMGQPQSARLYNAIQKINALRGELPASMIGGLGAQYLDMTGEPTSIVPPTVKALDDYLGGLGAMPGSRRPVQVRCFAKLQGTRKWKRIPFSLALRLKAPILSRRFQAMMVQAQQQSAMAAEQSATASEQMQTATAETREARQALRQTRKLRDEMADTDRETPQPLTPEEEAGGGQPAPQVEESGNPTQASPIQQVELEPMS